ncbi:MAG: hypothetical protein ACR2Q4_09085 [Geminicoccaceae bacterium]
MKRASLAGNGGLSFVFVSGNTERAEIMNDLDPLPLLHKPTLRVPPWSLLQPTKDHFPRQIEVDRMATLSTSDQQGSPAWVVSSFVL